MRETRPSEYLRPEDVNALIRAKHAGHEPIRSPGDAHWRCMYCGYVAEVVRWWPDTCKEIGDA